MEPYSFSPPDLIISMMQERPTELTGIFRTQAWAQAWLDIWGKDKRLELIDIGGRGRPREMLYRVKTKIKKLLPINALHLVGASSNIISTPRSEYNDISDLLLAAGSGELLCSELRKIRWNQFYLSDVLLNSASISQLQQNAAEMGWLVHEAKQEPAFYVKANNMVEYLHGLGANTRLAYFNRRNRLREIGEIEFENYGIDCAMDFFQLLNQFHLVRWGVPCYSSASQNFLKNFIERLHAEQGQAILDVMHVNGQVVSVLFDVVLNGCRYNFQSGYAEEKFPKIALGAIHMGYGIEAAITAGHIYDFMAGQGKHTNYKARIATHSDFIKSVSIERGVMKYLRQLQSYR